MDLSNFVAIAIVVVARFFFFFCLVDEIGLKEGPRCASVVLSPHLAIPKC